MNIPRRSGHATPHLGRTKNSRADEAMMVTAFASCNFSGRLAELPRLIAKPDSTEVELLVAEITKNIVAKLASGNIARGINDCSFTPAGADHRRDLRVTGLGHYISREFLLRMYEKVPG